MGRRTCRMKCREVGTMAGEAGVRVAEAGIEMTMASSQASCLDGVVAAVWSAVTIVAVSKMGQSHWVDGGRGVTDAGDTGR